MYRLKPIAIALLLFLLLVAGWISSARASSQLSAQNQEFEAFRLESSEMVSALEAKIDFLIDENSNLKAEIRDLNRELEDQPEFIPYDIPLDPELQSFTYETSREKGVDFDLVLLVMWKESGWVWHGPTMDENGLYSVGYMMINQIAWEDMAAAGYNVHTPEGNIAAGVEILSRHQEKYGEERSLVAYQCGEGKMVQNNWTHTPYSRWIMERVNMV